MKWSAACNRASQDATSLLSVISRLCLSPMVVLEDKAADELGNQFGMLKVCLQFGKGFSMPEVCPLQGQ